MTARERLLCDCASPAAAMPRVRRWQGQGIFRDHLQPGRTAPHPGLRCQPCQVKRACLQKVMTLLARSSPALFELVEAWTLDEHDGRV